VQEVPVSRAFEAYSTKPPQAHERILIRLFLMDEKHSENNHRGQLLVAALAAASIYTHNKLAPSFANRTQHL